MAVLFLSRNISAHVSRQKSAILFFVRVNQVLVRLWARHQSSVSVAGCQISDDWPSVTGDGRCPVDV